MPSTRAQVGGGYRSNARGVTQHAFQICGVEPTKGHQGPGPPVLRGVRRTSPDVAETKNKTREGVSLAKLPGLRSGRFPDLGIPQDSMIITPSFAARFGVPSQGCTDGDRRVAGRLRRAGTALPAWSRPR